MIDVREEIKSFWSKVPSAVFAVRAQAVKSDAAIVVGSVQLVSIDPPLASWAIRKHSRHVEAFRKSKRHAFALFEERNRAVLADVLNDHASLYERFAFKEGEDGTFCGEVVSEFDVGDHWVFILGIDIIRQPHNRGLVYVQRKVFGLN